MKKLLEDNIFVVSKSLINIGRIELLYLRGKNLYISFDYIMNSEKFTDKLNINVPFDIIDVKNFIISQINIKLSEFVIIKNDNFANNIENKKEFIGNPDFDYKRYL